MYISLYKSEGETLLSCYIIFAKADVSSDFAVSVLTKRKGNFMVCSDGRVDDLSTFKHPSHRHLHLKQSLSKSLQLMGRNKLIWGLDELC